MITFIDEKGTEHSALVAYSATNAVNGELSVKGTIYTNDKVLHGIDRGWRFRLDDEYYRVTYAKPNDAGRQIEVEFDAVHQFFYDMSKSMVYDTLNGSKPFETYLQAIFSGSGYTYNLETTVGSIRKENFGNKSRLSLFNDIIKAAGLEFSVRGHVVRILKRIGTDLSAIVRKDFNMNELKIEKNINSFVTYQRGLGAWKDDEDHSKGRYESEYESPLAKIYGRIEAEPVVDERYKETGKLLERLKENVDKSYKVSVEIDIEDLSRAGYRLSRPNPGDFIMAINETLGFRQKVRIVSFTSEYDVGGNLISRKVVCNDIGSVQRRASEMSSLARSVQDVAAENAKAIATATKALVSADGKNTIYFSESKPRDEPVGTLRKGDQLYLKEGEKTNLYFWNGAEWELNPLEMDLVKFRKEYESKTEEINQSMASQNQQTAQALRTAGTNASAIEAAKGAITKLNQDLASAKTDLTQAQGQLSSNIAQIRSDVGIIRTQQTVYEQTNAQNMSRIVGQLGDKASKSEVKQTADRIREELASLAVGGRNYFLNSGLEITSGYKEIQIHPDFVKHAKGKRFVISVQVSGENVISTGKGRFGLSISAGIAGSSHRDWPEVWETGTGNISKKRIYKVFEFRDNWIDFIAGLYVQTGNGAVTGFPKLEIGTIPTDWSPAPEDAEGLITEAKASFERTAQGLRTDLTAVQAYVSANGMIVEALRAYSREETARQLIAERKLIEAGYVGKAQHTEDVRGLTRRFEELTEGGVNLLRNSANLPTAGDYRNGKWVATSGGNGTAQVVPVTSSPSPLIKSMIRIVNNTVGNKDLSQAAMALVVGQKYTVSCYARVASDSPSPTVGLLIRSWANNNDANRKLHKTISNRDWERHSLTFTADAVANSIQFGQSGAGSVEICAPKIELGTVTTSWSPSPEDATAYADTKLAEYKQNVDGQFATISQQIAGKASQTDFQRVQETSKLYERLIGSTEKEITDKVSRMIMTNQLFQIEVSKNQGLRTVQSQLAGSWAVQNLNSNGDIVSQINLTGPNVRIQGDSIHLDGKTLIDNGIIKNAMIESVLADKITAGTLNAANVNIVNLNANKIVGLDANFIKSKIELAFIEWMKGKVITAQNDAMKIDLNAGQINYYTDKAALKRVLTGYPNQFVKFATGKVVGKGLAGVTIIGSNRYGNESSDDGGFVGIRAWNGPDIDQVDIVGDTVRLTSSPFESADGWDVITLPNKLEIDAHNVNHRVSSRVKVGDVWLWKNASTYSSMRETINLIIDNLQLLHNNKTTEKGYNYTMPAKI
ncbi:gp58-like family protein [Streptococcus cristatus]|uniref:Prophage endopeptidase tail n=1 Tax=Streptococcus cristatus TaxID=45634 RepID=A0A428GLK1_STRCR|nr:gp58-like family protein [Streptococcus cristatus]RSJ80026.1 Prophage endopeptidase tail [Streptococcus cristatus]